MGTRLRYLGLTAAWMLASACPALAANVVTTSLAVGEAPEQVPDTDAAPSRVETIQIVFEPGEEQQAIEALAAIATQSPGDTPLTLLCATGGAMSANDCTATASAAKRALPARDVDVETFTRSEHTPLPRRAPSDWKGVLTVVRTITSGVAVGVTATISKGADWKQALVLGGVAGGWSGVMQLLNRPRLNWQAHQSWLGFSPPEPHEKAGLVKRYLKRAMQTGLYAGLLLGSFQALGLAGDAGATELARRALVTVAESLYTQTAWEALNQEWTEAAIRRNPERAHVYKRLSGIASLVQAIVNVTANALNVGGVHVGGIHAGSVIAGTVGTSGALMYFSRYVPRAVSHAVKRLAWAALSPLPVACRYAQGALRMAFPR